MRNTVDLSSDVVTAATLVIGIALLTAPERTSSVLGLGTEPITSRAIGGADLVLGFGLAFGQPRWPWMAARAALNVVLATAYLRLRHDPVVGRQSRRGAVAMAALTVSDAALAVGLRCSGRGRRHRA